MDGVDFEFEEVFVSEAIGLSLHGFDFVVGSFEGSGGDGEVIVGEDSPSVVAKSVGKLDWHFDTAGFGQSDPIQEKESGFVRVLLFPDFVQEFFEVIGGGQRLMDGQSFLGGQKMSGRKRCQERMALG